MKIFTHTIAVPTILLVALVISSTIRDSVQNHNKDNPNPDYVNPNTIEFKLKDKDFDGKKETYIKIKDQEYLFKYVNGKPAILPYEVSISTKGDKK